MFAFKQCFSNAVRTLSSKFFKAFVLLTSILLIYQYKSVLFSYNIESNVISERLLLPSATEPCIPGLAKPILTIFTSTRLGNQMYAYATLFAELQKVNQSRKGFIHPFMSNYLAEYFKITLPILKHDDFEAVNWTLQDIDDGHPTSLSLPEDVPCLRLCCYPQQWQLFDDHRPLIMNEFTFHRHIIKETVRIKSSIRDQHFGLNTSETATFVGIHVRRDDYVEHAKFLGLHLPELPFYSAAMAYAAKKYLNIVFIVTSDNITSCKLEFAPVMSLYKIQFMEREQDDGGLDMALLSSCDHVIFGIGTFGFWAAYLNQGEKIYCDCATSNSMLKDYHKFVPPTWTAISVDGELLLQKQNSTV